MHGPETLAAAKSICERKEPRAARDLIGTLFRNQEEIYDVQKKVEEFAPDALMWAVSGGRADYKTPFRKIEKIKRDLARNNISVDLTALLKDFPQTKPQFFDRIHTLISGSAGYEDFLFDLFVQDIDISVIRGSLGGKNTIRMTRGNITFTKIDLILTRPETIVHNEPGLSANAFNRAIRIIF